MPSMLSVPAFIADHGISRSLFYRLLKEGRGPRLTKIARRTLVSSEAAAEWRARMERETNQAAPVSEAKKDRTIFSPLSADMK
jgi:predicted DNA-binding transcriptional regulator AlpA